MKIQYIVSLSITVLMLSICGIPVKAQQDDLVKIGKLSWSTRNLSVCKFRNGDPIPEARTDDEWNQAIAEGKPAWCYYNNDSSYDALYGKLYNWFAVSDPRGLAPEGYRIATENDWLSVMSSVMGSGEELIARGEKELEGMAGSLMNQTGWDSIINSNAKGFSALPGGCRLPGGSYGKGFLAYWWTTSTNDYSIVTFIINNKQDILSRLNSRNEGYSVRCVKDRNSTIYRNQEMIILDQVGTIKCMLSDRNNTLWLGTDKGIIRVDKKQVTRYTQKDGLPSDLVTCMAADKNNNLWIGTEYHGIARFDGKTWTKYDVKKNNMIYSIGVDSKGVVWVINYEGLLYFDGGKWTFAEGKEAKFIGVGSRLAIDSHDIVWIVHEYFNGLFCYVGRKFIFNPNHSKTNFWHSNCIFADKNDHIWVGTSIAKDGSILLPEYSGAIEYDGLKFRRCLEGQNVSNITQTGNGDMWMSTGKELYRNYEKYPFDKTFGNIAPAAGNNLWTSYAGSVIYLDLQNSFVDKRNNQLYNTTEIEGKSWMTDNLNAVSFRNGDPIRFVTTKAQWVEACEKSIPAYCYYDFKNIYKDIYGALYNFAAISDPRGLAPAGWHIPSREECMELLDAHGTEEEAFVNMKSEQGWQDSKNGKNMLGFNATPGGLLFDTGDPSGLGKKVIWWSRDSNTRVSGNAYVMQIGFTSDNASVISVPIQAGAYVRCVKD